MGIIEVVLLIGAGLFAGFINTIAGGGSLLTLPLLIFLGLPSSEANASNRVGIFMQNIFSVAGFKSKGVAAFPFAIYVAIPATIGAVIGSQIAIDIRDELFNRILAVVMVVVMVVTTIKPNLKSDIEKEMKEGKIWLNMIAFFFVGLYGGFIQAGIGFLMIAILTLLNGFGMVKTNSIKVFVAFTYTIAALVIFQINGKIRWEYGLTLAVGTATGGWIASRWSVEKSDRLIRIILMIMVLGLSIKLWFFN